MGKYRFKHVMFFCIHVIYLAIPLSIKAQSSTERSVDFNKGWKLLKSEAKGVSAIEFNDSTWQSIDLPHDGSIEEVFNEKNSVGVHGGYLPTGTYLYRKTFFLNKEYDGKCIFIDFDGIYRNSEVWINGHYLGKRPNGYISFRYELTRFLQYDNKKNIILVRVDNFAQPGSRWYTGTGIYRNVWLTSVNKTHIDHWGVYITSPRINKNTAVIRIETAINHNLGSSQSITLKQILLDHNSRQIKEISTIVNLTGQKHITEQQLLFADPHLWKDRDPYLYTILTQIIQNNRVIDEHRTKYGLRYFRFDPLKGFFLNGEKVKIKGVCNHHDLGCLGAAVNKSAIKRQLQILKGMGCNAIRTAHNPPAPDLLDLCDEMGFIVMNEAFDVWTISKTPFDYHWNWNEWHKRDLEDQVKRDRNHPSVFIWSIGNEIPEQLGHAGKGAEIAKELRNIIRNFDTTRPITAGNNYPQKENTIIQSGALDLIGVNYRHTVWELFPSYYPGKIFIGTETVSALQTRGEYMFPSDKLLFWGDPANPVVKNPFDFTSSSFDQIRAPWGSTHEETLKIFKENDFVSGMFIWSGFDYLGEPTPYSWPARSSYFGIIDLAGFPKDVYYLYQSEWTNKPVLHIFPHWNWKEDELVDVWAYYNYADEVELFLNNQSLGVKKKSRDQFHVMWRVKFTPGVLKAVSRKHGKVVLTREIKTAGKPSRIILSSNNTEIKVKDKELSFVTAKVVDAHGSVVPKADNLISFEINGNAIIAGVDNGNPISHEPFKAKNRKAFNGMALVLVQPKEKIGSLTVIASSPGLQYGEIKIEVR